MSKNILAIFLIVVLIGGALGFRYYQKNARFYKPPVLDIKPLDVDIVQVATTTLPTKFPADFPIEKGAIIRSNYTAESEGVFQATRSFVSKNSADENYLLYLDYLQKNDWGVMLKSDDPESKYIYAEKIVVEDGKKGKASVTISVNKIIVNNLDQVGVNISFVYR